MKKLISVLLCLVFALSLSFSVFADEGKWYIGDRAGLLSQSELQEINEKLREVSEKYGCDVLISTVTSLNGADAEDLSESCLRSNLTDPDGDGIIFLYAVEDRECVVSTGGKCDKAFNEEGRNHVIDEMEKDLKAGNYVSAFNAYADTCGELLQMNEDGHPYPVSTLYKLMHKALPVGILIALLLGFLFAGIPLAKMKAEINNVKWKKDASDYSRKGSMQVLQAYDNFLYTNTTRTKVASSSSSKSGGSSGHSTSRKI